VRTRRIERGISGGKRQLEGSVRHRRHLTGVVGAGDFNRAQRDTSGAETVAHLKNRVPGAREVESMADDGTVAKRRVEDTIRLPVPAVLQLTRRSFVVVVTLASKVTGVMVVGLDG